MTYGLRADSRKDLYFLVKPADGLTVASTAGKWDPEKGYVRVPAKEASEFFVSIEQK